MKLFLLNKQAGHEGFGWRPPTEQTLLEEMGPPLVRPKCFFVFFLQHSGPCVIFHSFCGLGWGQGFSDEELGTILNKSFSCWLCIYTEVQSLHLWFHSKTNFKHIRAEWDPKSHRRKEKNLQMWSCGLLTLFTTEYTHNRENNKVIDHNCNESSAHWMACSHFITLRSTTGLCSLLSHLFSSCLPQVVWAPVCLL